MPIIESLRSEGYKMNEVQNAKKKRVLLLNIMPDKQRTELDFARALANVEGFDVELLLAKFAGQTYKNTPQEYVDRFYEDWEKIVGLDAHAGVPENPLVDGVIITGAPLEFMPFEEVRYWPQLCRLMDWCRVHVPSTLYVCWGAQAAAYHFFGIDKRLLQDKMFGIFKHRTMGQSKLLEGISPIFTIPHSRHTEVSAADILLKADQGLNILACGEGNVGVGLAATQDCKEVLMFGHPEYAADTLHREYLRDLSKGLPIKAPENYYMDSSSECEINFSWREDALTFYHNWVKYCL